MKKIIIGTLVFSLINTSLNAWSLLNKSKSEIVTGSYHHTIDCKDANENGRVITISEDIKYNLWSFTGSRKNSYNSLYEAANDACSYSSSSSSSSSSDSGSGWETAGKVLLGAMAVGAVLNSNKSKQAATKQAATIIIYNGCSQNLMLAFKYLSESSTVWVTDGLYLLLKKNKSNFINDKGIAIKTKHPFFYFYAGTDKRAFVRGKKEVNVNGKKFYMAKQPIEDGDVIALCQ